jgi:maleate isomerase
MVDSLGYRKKFGVIAPSTNTSVQPEFDEMRPPGVTNHFSRIFIPDDPIQSDDDFDQLMVNIRKELMAAIDRVVTCHPDYLVMGMSAETFWDGLEGSKEFRKKVEERAGLSVSVGSDASQEALHRYSEADGNEIKRIAVITPYMPVGDKNVIRFFTDCGYKVVVLKGLKYIEGCYRRAQQVGCAGDRPSRHQSRHGPFSGSSRDVPKKTGDRH